MDSDEMMPEKLYEIIIGAGWEHLNTQAIQQLAELTDADYIQLVRQLLSESQDDVRYVGCVLTIMRPLSTLYADVLEALLRVTDRSVIAVGATAMLQLRSSDSVALDLLAVLDQHPTDAMRATIFQLFAGIGVTSSTLYSPCRMDIVFASRLRPLWRERTIPRIRYGYLDDIALRIITHMLNTLEGGHQELPLRDIVISLLQLHQLDTYPQPLQARITHVLGRVQQSGDSARDLHDRSLRSYKSPYGSKETLGWVWVWSLSAVFEATIHDLIYFYQQLQACDGLITILDEERSSHKVLLEALHGQIRSLFDGTIFTARQDMHRVFGWGDSSFDESSTTRPGEMSQGTRVMTCMDYIALLSNIGQQFRLAGVQIRAVVQQYQNSYLISPTPDQQHALQRMDKTLEDYIAYIEVVWEAGFVTRVHEECLS